MIYLLRDDFDGCEELSRLKGQFADRGILELNTTVLEGRTLDFDELVRACEAMPFLADRRLVIVRRLLSRFQARNSRPGDHRSPAPDAPSSRGGKGRPAKPALEEQLCGFLAHVPEFVDLVFVEDASITASQPAFKAIAKARGKVVQRDKPLKGQALIDWIEHRLRTKGGKIASDAARELAAFGGEDLRALDNDLEKLLTYAGARQIALEDVHALVTDAREDSIFAFVDAIGEGSARHALVVLHQLLLDGSAPAYLLAMIVRQFRLLLQIKELGPSTSPDEIASRIQVHRFAAQKISQQARRFTLEWLEAAYQILVRADAAIKTGRVDPETALDLLVIDLSRPTTA